MIWECLKCLHVYNIELASQFELSFFYVVYSFFMSRTLVTAAVTAAEFKLNRSKTSKFKLYATDFWHQTEASFNVIG